AEMTAADGVLRRLPGREADADRLAAEFWLRRASGAMHAERREEAVLLALAALPDGGAGARRILAELIGDDLARLRATFRFSSAPLDWSVDWDSGHVAVADRAAWARRLDFDPNGPSPRGASASPARIAPAASGSVAALPEPALGRDAGADPAAAVGAPPRPAARSLHSRSPRSAATRAPAPRSPARTMSWPRLRPRFGSRLCSMRRSSARSASTSLVSPARSASICASCTSGPTISCSC